MKISEEFKGQGKVCKCAVRLKDSFHSKPVWKLLSAHLSGEVIQAPHLDEVRTVSRCPCTVSFSLSTLTHKGLTPHKPPQLLSYSGEQLFCLSANIFFNSEQSKWRTNCLMSLQEIPEKDMQKKVVFMLFLYAAVLFDTTIHSVSSLATF